MRDEGEERRSKSVSILNHTGERTDKVFFFFTLLLEIRLLLTTVTLTENFQLLLSCAMICTSQQDPCFGISAKIRSRTHPRPRLSNLDKFSIARASHTD